MKEFMLCARAAADFPVDSFPPTSSARTSRSRTLLPDDTGAQTSVLALYDTRGSATVLLKQVLTVGVSSIASSKSFQISLFFTNCDGNTCIIGKPQI